MLMVGMPQRLTLKLRQEYNSAMKTYYKIIFVILGVVVLVAGGLLIWRYYQNGKVEEKKPAPVVVEIKTGAKYIPPEEIEKSIVRGEKKYLSDPVESARNQGVKYGFSLDDSFVLEQKNFAPSEDTYLAVVKSTHKGLDYDVVLLEVSGVGNNDVWTIASVELAR
jgi:hypothetical protein